jgi:hypothetical protein
MTTLKSRIVIDKKPKRTRAKKANSRHGPRQRPEPVIHAVEEAELKAFFARMMRPPDPRGE